MLAPTYWPIVPNGVFAAPLSTIRVQRSSASARHLDDVVAAVAGVDEHVGDEVDLVAVVARVVAGRGVRSAGEEEVREARGLDAEERRRAVGPVVRRARGRRGPRIPMRVSAPVPKSKPVAHTMMSNSRTPSVVSMPVSVIRTIGVSRRSTSDTFGSLNASK